MLWKNIFLNDFIFPFLILVSHGQIVVWNYDTPREDACVCVFTWHLQMDPMSRKCKDKNIRAGHTHHNYKLSITHFLTFPIYSFSRNNDYLSILFSICRNRSFSILHSNLVILHLLFRLLWNEFNFNQNRHVIWDDGNWLTLTKSIRSFSTNDTNK